MPWNALALNMAKRYGVLGLVALLVCAPALHAQQDVAGVPDAASPAYIVGADDELLVQVLDLPEVGKTPQRVDPNGDFRLPMIGRVRAAGKSLEVLEAELTDRFKEFLHEPDVTVSVTDFQSQPVSVIGAVRSSGVHQLEGRKTLIEILSLAGGPADDAGPTVRITRRLDWGALPLAGAVVDPAAGFSTAEVDLQSLMAAIAPEQNIVIRPHDVISVPRAEVVYVIGEVTRSGPVPLSSGHSVSVMEAVSSAGGVLRTAKSSEARILRRAEGDAKRVELDVDLQKIMRGEDDDLQLRAGDILIVPDSSGKRAVGRILEAAVQLGVVVATYGVVRR